MKQRPTSVVNMLLATSMIALAGCEQAYHLNRNQSSMSTENLTPTNPTGVTPTIPETPVTPTVPVVPVVPMGPPTPVVVAPPVVVPPIAVPTSAMNVETFNAAANQVKKIDFLFVVDNSGSMYDNQKKLAAGFKNFANAFYRRADLDICTAIITSDRYLGRSDQYKSGTYYRERKLPCTKPAGSAFWNAGQMQAHIDSLIQSFEEQVYVGTYGDGYELMGKSLVSFLYNLNAWGDTINPEKRNAFFRKDAVANITFITDENNYFNAGVKATDDEIITEEKNDLPYTTGAMDPTDKRTGIKNYLDAYFGALNPTLSYSTTSILETTRPSNVIPGLNTNLDALSSAVGRESTKSNVNDSISGYTDVYTKIADAIVLRASAFNLAYPIAGDLAVRILRASGEVVNLSAATDYTQQSSSSIVLNPSVLPAIQNGDKIQVSYRYML